MPSITLKAYILYVKNMQNITVDDLDRSILRILRQDARTTINDIAKNLDRRRATIYNRIVKMEENGVIKGYTVIPNFSSLGEDITVFILVTLTEKEYLIADSLSQIGNKLSKIPYVTGVHAISGEYDYLLKARVPSLEVLGNEINFHLRKMSGVGRTLTLTSFDTTTEELGNNSLFQLSQK